VTAVCIEPPVLRFRTTIMGRGTAAAIVLSEEQVASIAGSAKTPPVSVTLNGRTFAGRVGRMGGESLVGLNRAVRQEVGVEAGDVVDVEIVVDLGARPIDMPTALTEALAADPDARARFDALAPSRRKEIARRISEAKRPDTAARRLGETLDELRS
jgi:hypothetical protein